MGDVENVRLGDLRPPIMKAFSVDVRLLVLLWGCVLCVYAARALGPLSQSLIVESSCYVDFHRIS
jgi:hypothetical protein